MIAAVTAATKRVKGKYKKKSSAEEDGGNESVVGEQVTALRALDIASLSRRRRSRHQGEIEQPTYYTRYTTSVDDDQQRAELVNV